MLIGPSGGWVGNIDLQGQAGLRWAWGQLQFDVQYTMPGRFSYFRWMADVMAGIG